MKKILIAAAVIAALGGSYYLGTRTTPTTPQSRPEESVKVSRPIVDDLVVPTGLTIPAQLPEMTIDEPSKVLAGEVKVPVDLLRIEPPAAQPNLIIPMIPK